MKTNNEIVSKIKTIFSECDMISYAKKDNSFIFYVSEIKSAITVRYYYGWLDDSNKKILFYSIDDRYNLSQRVPNAERLQAFKDALNHNEVNGTSWLVAPVDSSFPVDYKIIIDTQDITLLQDAFIDLLKFYTEELA